MSEEKKTRQMPAWMEEHVRLYQTDPERAHLWDSAHGGSTGLIPTLLLTTKGRKSGHIYQNPLIYGKTGSGFAVIASKGGAQEHPGWYLNLLADPEVEIQVGAQHYKARARTAAGAERKAIWAEMARLFPPYDAYQARTAREIPVVVLEPQR